MQNSCQEGIIRSDRGKYTNAHVANGDEGEGARTHAVLDSSPGNGQRCSFEG